MHEHACQLRRSNHWAHAKLQVETPEVQFKYMHVKCMKEKCTSAKESRKLRDIGGGWNIPLCTSIMWQLMPKLSVLKCSLLVSVLI